MLQFRLSFLMLSVCCYLLLAPVAANAADNIDITTYLSPKDMDSFLKERSRKRSSWMLSGSFKMTYEPGIYHLHYQNIVFQKNSKKLLSGMEFILSIGYLGSQDILDSSDFENEELSLLGGINKNIKQNDTMFIMTFGKSW